MRESIQERISIEFDEALKEIPINRIKNGVDKDKRSIREVTSKLVKHPLFPKLKEDLENFKFKDE